MSRKIIVLVKIKNSNTCKTETKQIHNLIESTISVCVDSICVYL